MHAPTVGNDVVHLSDPQIASHHRRPRFVERVCCEDEVRRVGLSDAPHRLLWSLFAAKEAAFKAVVKLRPGIPFAHRRFQVATSLTEVVYDDFTLRLRLTEGVEWVHAVATTPPSRPLFALSRGRGEIEQSAACRALLCRVVASRYTLPFDGLSIHRAKAPGSWDGYGPPELYLDDRVLPIDISLSHDGPFMACASVPTADARTLGRATPTPDGFGASAPSGWSR